MRMQIHARTLTSSTINFSGRVVMKKIFEYYVCDYPQDEDICINPPHLYIQGIKEDCLIYLYEDEEGNAQPLEGLFIHCISRTVIDGILIRGEGDFESYPI